MSRRLPIWIGCLCISLTAALAAGRASALAGPTVKFVLEDGAKVSDTATIVAKVTPDGDVEVEKVEFAVDDQLKATDQSTPYSFDWDTLEEKEGEHTVVATVFDAKGRTARAKLTVMVDNELAKGADFHATAALDALKEGDVPKATRFARRALKIEPTNFKAARALAGIYRSNGDLDKAVAILDKAEMPAKEIEARKELIALHIAKADDSPGTEEFLAECMAAVEIWKKVNELRIADAKAGHGPEAAITLGDAYFAAHDWPNATRAYLSTGDVDSAPREALGRYVLAQIRAGKYREAALFVDQIKRAKRADESTPVLESMLRLMEHQFDKARDLVQDGLDNNYLPAIVARMYANLPLAKDKESMDLADKAVKAAPTNPDVLLVSAFVQRDPIDSRKALIRALAVDPATPEAYGLQAYLIMLSREKKRYQAADLLLDYALKLDPNNLYCLMAKIVCLQAQKRPQEAEPLLAQMLALDKAAPDVHVAQALNLSLLDKTLQITAEMQTAFKLDPDRWAEVFVPKPTEIPLKVFKYRYQPVMSPETLYAGK